MNKLFACYSILFLLFAIFSFLFVDRNISYLHSLYSGFNIEHRFIASIAYFILVCMLYVCYGMLLLLGKNLSFKKLRNLIVVIGLVLLVSYPAMLSYDIFNYILTAKVFVFYRENPYSIIPQEFISEPYLVFTRAINKTALYGPVWLLISAVPFILGFGNFLLTILNYKLIAVASYFLMSALLWKITKSISSVMFFSLNPLVVIETCISSHNDMIMMLLALFSFYLLSQKKYLISFGLLLGSIFIKFATLFLMPLYILQIKKKKLDWNKAYRICAYILSGIFLLSFLREEIYPWYAIWPLTFFAASKFSKREMIFLFFVTFGLMLRYIPFMSTGNYFGLTPIYRELLTLIPLLCFGIYFVICKIYFPKKLVF